MWLKLIAFVILVCCCGDHCALSNFNESISNGIQGTSNPVGRTGYRDPRHFANAEERGRYLRHNYIDEVFDNTANSYQEIQQDRHSAHADHQYDQQNHKTHINLLLEPGKGDQEDPVCSKFFRFSILGTAMSMLVLFNGIITGTTLYKSVMSASSDSTINTITNINTNNNADVNTNENDNNNMNFNDNFLDDRQLRQGRRDSNFDFEHFDDDKLSTEGRNGETIKRKASCTCPRSRGIKSWLSTAKRRLQGVWASAGDFLSENPECASRMACEVASPYVPSSVAPLLAILPPRMEEVRTLLTSAASENCALAYDRCPISLDPAIITAMEWLS
ncbi:uncharacterized protein [Palaemon carinicauda]|uniref:uncharacterized protein n=1 Tax=Palaemon carinicauda TaxID=392227 RepID=UPI0035B65A56